MPLTERAAQTNEVDECRHVKRHGARTLFDDHELVQTVGVLCGQCGRNPYPDIISTVVATWKTNEARALAKGA